MRKKITIIMSVLTLICVSYYTVKLYYVGALSFSRDSWLGCTILYGMLVIVLSFSILNSLKIEKLHTQNSELKQLIVNLIEDVETNQFEALHSIKNNHETLLDTEELANAILSKLSKGGE